MSYEAVKFFHIVFLVLWLGPATGAYWIVLRMGKQNSSDITLRLEKFFEEMLLVEHFAFFGLLATGLWLWHKIQIPLHDLRWLEWKMLPVALVFVIEIFDIWLSHLYFRRRVLNNSQHSPKNLQDFLKIRKIFYRITVPLLFVLIPVIMALAVFRPV